MIIETIEKFIATQPYYDTTSLHSRLISRLPIMQFAPSCVINVGSALVDDPSPEWNLARYQFALWSWATDHFLGKYHMDTYRRVIYFEEEVDAILFKLKLG